MPPQTDPLPGVPLLDIGRQNQPIQGEVLAAICRVLDSGQFVLGPEVIALEEELAAYCGTRHAIGCASGSDALLLSLMAVGVGRGDEVILPSFTFFATAGSVWRLGARPVFVDIDPQTFNLDAERVEEAITPQTRAILPVHLFGLCADMQRIGSIAAAHGIPVIEDAAQSIGAERDGRRAGAWGDLGAFSFYPTKNLGGMGDGGIVTTDDDDLADRVRCLRNHGQGPQYHHSAVGMNSRLDSLQAAALRVKLPHLDHWTEKRIDNAARYRRLFAESGLDAAIGLPAPAPGERQVWNQFTVRVPGGQRDALLAHLRATNIGAAIYYPMPLHRQECFATLGLGEGSLPHTERACREVLSLPIFAELAAGEQERVVERIEQFFAADRVQSKAA